jgi:hypothetical protein
MRNSLLLAFFSFTFVSCSSVKTNKTTNNSPNFTLLNSIEIPFNKEFKNTVVGGLSSIDYDAKNDLYYFICDDRAVYNDARFYTAKIHLGTNKIDSVAFQNVISLKNAAGAKYSNWEQQPEKSIDPEELRYNPKTNSVVWSSEGARVISKDFSVLQHPAIQTATVNGNFVNRFDLPANLNMQKEEKGPRNNGVLEGITFNKNYRTLYTSIEEPLYEDDSKASLTKGGLIRLYSFDVKSGKNKAQYAYELDPIAQEPNPKDGFAVNGVSAIQYYGTDQLLIVERSYSVGKQACTIKVYLCDFSKATDVKNIASLQHQTFTAASKKLILNMDNLGVFIDNIEGLTFGPKLANGKQSLLFVSDNNFSDKQKTQVLLFEVDYDFKTY